MLLFSSMLPLENEKIAVIGLGYVGLPVELVLLPVLIALASLVGFVPGMTAYRTDVAKALAG